MNFDLSEEQQLLADSLKRYLANEYTMDARSKIVDSPTGWSEKVWAAFAEMGLLGVPFAEEHGGFGGSAVDVMLVMEALGEGLVVEPYWVNVGLGGRLIARAGSEAQQKRILPPLIQGKHRLAFAHTERGARYDLGHVQARAKKSGAGYTLEGEKRVAWARLAMVLMFGFATELAPRIAGEPAQKSVAFDVHQTAVALGMGALEPLEG